eukprot:TRINITY_DN8522_c0_g2_i1.p2 TRINITY_DN8522_c0_g2~~TRINITY_DN8522_c0_g2_i1.p2  ORF type:complete len:226 (+),score=84.01 TRINITY_DN8522_c0_g2_i1:263-940(+)
MRELKSSSELESRQFKSGFDRKEREACLLQAEVGRFETELKRLEQEGRANTEMVAADLKAEHALLMSTKQRENSRLKAELERIKSDAEHKGRVQLSAAAVEAQELRSEVEAKDDEIAQLRLSAELEGMELRAQFEAKQRENEQLRVRLNEVTLKQDQEAERALVQLKADAAHAVEEGAKLRAEVARLSAEGDEVSNRLKSEAEVQNNELRLELSLIHISKPTRPY